MSITMTLTFSDISIFPDTITIYFTSSRLMIVSKLTVNNVSSSITCNTIWYVLQKLLFMMSAHVEHNRPLARYVKLRIVNAPGMPGTFPRYPFQRKSLVIYPGVHHGTCTTHVPWCMSGSITLGGGKTFPAFPAHVQPAIFRIWQEAHGQN